MNIWFTADTHFYHVRILQYCPRPYSSVEEMNEKLIENYNSVVKKDDLVFHLGDFSLQSKYVPEILSRLNGEKHLIVGNHDRCWDAVTKPHKVGQAHWKQQYLDWGFASVGLHKRLIGQLNLGMGEPLNLSHMPYRGAGDHTYTERYSQFRLEDEGIPLLQGHIHSLPENRVRHTEKGTIMVDVGVDPNNYFPVSIEEVRSIINANR